MNNESQEFIICEICNKKFRSAVTLATHKRKFHGLPEDDLELNKFMCDSCGRQFSAKFNLQRHLKESCKGNDSIKKSDCFTCMGCGRTFSSKFSLNRHSEQCCQLALQNSTNVKTKKSRIKCPLCEEHFVTNNLLHNHIIIIHEIELLVEEHTFDSEEEFKNWKNVIESETVSRYVQDTGAKQTGNTFTRYYNCHRSFEQRCAGQNVRASKGLLTNKTGFVCPARMDVITTENSFISVSFCKTHVGHGMDIGRVFLSKDARNEIAGKLKAGVSFNHILDEVRDVKTGIENERLLLLERKDLHNISRDFGISFNTKRHADDAVSVKLWVEEMRELGDDCPILYFKEQGKSGEYDELRLNDFGLIIMTPFQGSLLKKFGNNKICIDGTHGTNAYDFQLYTLMTIDEYGSGCPVAFCFSNREDELIFKIFFQYIKRKVGVIHTNVFMSDDAPAFYNAWSSTMSSVPNKLLCTWHVDRNWQQNLGKISGGSEVKILVYKTIRVLLTEQSIENFSKLAKITLQELLNDPNTCAFGKYFEKYYLNRPEQWAYCHRVGLGINTNMYLESMHKTLKHIYLEGKKAKRLDKSINALMNFTRDKLFQRLIKISKNKPTEKISMIRASHSASQVIKPEMIRVISAGNEWQVQSSNMKRKYDVILLVKECEGCPLQCNECNICVHDFKCSCIDYTLRLNMCKHIHAVKQYTVGSACALVTNKSCSSIQEYNDIISHLQIESKSNPTFYDIIRKKTDMIAGLTKNNLHLNDEDQRTVIRNLDNTIAILNKGFVALNTVEEINVNKNIDKQTRLFSTKKRISKTHQLRLATPIESENIKEGLMNDPHEIINIHTTFDHTYTK